MTKFDNARYKISTSLNNKFDYDLFVQECFKQSIPTMSIHEYYYKLGLLEWASSKYPDIYILDAYLKLIEYLNKQEIEQQLTGKVDFGKPCGSCGGGKIV